MIKYEGLNLQSESINNLSSPNLLILPEEGNNQLYLYGDQSYDYDNRDRMLIPMIIDSEVLEEDLYTHVLVTTNLNLDVSLQSWDLYSIEDLNPVHNIVEIPVGPEGRIYIRLSNKFDLFDDPRGFDNIPAVIWVVEEDNYPAVITQTEHFTYIDNIDFECIFFEREVQDPV